MNINLVRYFSQQVSPGSRYVKPLSGLRKYLVEKCFGFIKGYERILETNFPAAFKIYQVFSVGTKDLYTDVKEYIRISSALRSGKSVRNLQRTELETYFKAPKDLMKVGPVLLVAALPFANYVILPIIYLFPRQFLSSHFWTLQQRLDFSVRSQRKKLYYYRPVFRHLQAKVHSVHDHLLRDKCQDLFYKLGSGTHPTVEEIIDIKPLFINKPYGLDSLSTKHLRDLCSLHGVSRLPGIYWRLWKHAGFLREMDLAIQREGLESMSNNELRTACFIRGMSPLGLKKEEMILWLSNWIFIAQNADSKSLSLILHCPIFLSYNSPTNWVLIH